MGERRHRAKFESVKSYLTMREKSKRGAIALLPL